jgi:hypothetical protein
MTRSPKIMFAYLGTLLAVAAAQAAPATEAQAQSNGPNMPPSGDIVPSDVRPQGIPATGGMRKPDAPGTKSSPHVVKRPPVRPPDL